MSFFLNTKNHTPLFSQSSVVYKFFYPFWILSYTVKTARILFERKEEHACPSKNKNDESANYEHLSACYYYNHQVCLFNIDNLDIQPEIDIC